MTTSAQISVYPLRQEHLGPAVESVRSALEEHGLAPQVGANEHYCNRGKRHHVRRTSRGVRQGCKYWPSGHDHYDFQRLPGLELIPQWQQTPWPKRLPRIELAKLVPTSMPSGVRPHSARSPSHWNMNWFLIWPGL